MRNAPGDDNDFLKETKLLQSFGKISMGNCIDTGRILDECCFSRKYFDSADLHSEDLDGANFSGEGGGGHHEVVKG